MRKLRGRSFDFFFLHFFDEYPSLDVVPDISYFDKLWLFPNKKTSPKVNIIQYNAPAKQHKVKKKNPKDKYNKIYLILILYIIHGISDV